jgi:hypothetical protein
LDSHSEGAGFDSQKDVHNFSACRLNPSSVFENMKYTGSLLRFLVQIKLQVSPPDHPSHDHPVQPTPWSKVLCKKLTGTHLVKWVPVEVLSPD